MYGCLQFYCRLSIPPRAPWCLGYLSDMCTFRCKTSSVCSLLNCCAEEMVFAEQT
jgi:hypothetical protein